MATIINWIFKYNKYNKKTIVFNISEIFWYLFKIKVSVFILIKAIYLLLRIKKNKPGIKNKDFEFIIIKFQVRKLETFSRIKTYYFLALYHSKLILHLISLKLYFKK